jgi:hypothetical protein
MDDGQPYRKKGRKDKPATNPPSHRNTPFSLVTFLRKRKEDEERRIAIEEEEKRRRIRRQIAKKRRAAIIRKLRAEARRKKGPTGKNRDSAAAHAPTDEDLDEDLLDDELLDDFTDDDLDDGDPDDEDLLDEELEEEPSDDDDSDEEEWEEEEPEDAEEDHGDDPSEQHDGIPRLSAAAAPPSGEDSHEYDTAAEDESRDGDTSGAEPFSLAPGEVLPPATPVRPPSPIAIAIGFVVYFLIPAILAIGLVIWIINRPDTTLPEVQVQTPPKKPKLEDLINASQTAMQRGDFQRAGKIASEALTVYPEDFRSHLNAASLKIKAGKLAEAGPDLKRASELAPRNPDPISMRAEWAFLSGHFKEARDLHRRLYPYSTQIPPIVTLQLYVCEMALGNPAEANLLLEKNPLPSPSLEWFWLRTLQARHQGSSDESRRLAESTLPLYGDQAKAAIATFKRLGWPERDLLAPAPGVALPSL